MRVPFDTPTTQHNSPGCRPIVHAAIHTTHTHTLFPLSLYLLPSPFFFVLLALALSLTRLASAAGRRAPCELYATHVNILFAPSGTGR